MHMIQLKLIKWCNRVPKILILVSHIFVPYHTSKWFKNSNVEWNSGSLEKLTFYKLFQSLWGWMILIAIVHLVLVNFILLIFQSYSHHSLMVIQGRRRCGWSRVAHTSSLLNSNCTIKRSLKPVWDLVKPKERYVFECVQCPLQNIFF